MDLERPEEVLKQVDDAIEQGELDKAQALCEEMLTRDPDSIEARIYLAAIAVEDGDEERVIELGEEILERDPDNIETRLVLAESFLAMEDPERAIVMCKEILERDPDNLDGRYLMAETMQEVGFFAEAADMYQSVLEGRPDDVAAMVGLGVAQYDCFRIDDAKSTLEEALELDPDVPDAHFFLGLILERQGDEVGSRRAFKRAMDLDPELYPPALKLSLAEFEVVVDDVLGRLPEKLRNYLANVPISVEEIPSDEDLSSETPPLSPNLWGMFRGQSLPEQIDDPFTHIPSEIVLYRANLQRGVCTRDELIEEIEITLQHEIAHFLGLNEEQVAELGLA